MSTPDAIRRLLEGEIDPIEIEGDANLYSMAERIYGSEVLEEMGVSPPEVDDSSSHDGIGLIPNDVTLPELMPSIPTLKSEKAKRGKMRLMTLFFGIFGLARTCSDLFGSIWMRPDTSGYVRKRPEAFRHFRKIWKCFGKCL